MRIVKVTGKVVFNLSFFEMLLGTTLRIVKIIFMNDCDIYEKIFRILLATIDIYT